MQKTLHASVEEKACRLKLSAVSTLLIEQIINRRRNMLMTQEYETWWREHGQFLEPMGDIKDERILAFVKRCGQSIWYQANEVEVGELRDTIAELREELKELGKY